MFQLSWAFSLSLTVEKNRTWRGFSWSEFVFWQRSAALGRVFIFFSSMFFSFLAFENFVLNFLQKVFCVSSCFTVSVLSKNWMICSRFFKKVSFFWQKASLKKGMSVWMNGECPFFEVCDWLVWVLFWKEPLPWLYMWNKTCCWKKDLFHFSKNK